MLKWSTQCRVMKELQRVQPHFYQKLGTYPWLLTPLLGWSRGCSARCGRNQWPYETPLCSTRSNLGCIAKDRHSYYNPCKCFMLIACMQCLLPQLQERMMSLQRSVCKVAPVHGDLLPESWVPGSGRSQCGWKPGNHRTGNLFTSRIVGVWFWVEDIFWNSGKITCANWRGARGAACKIFYFLFMVDFSFLLACTCATAYMWACIQEPAEEKADVHDLFYWKFNNCRVLESLEQYRSGC